jgi:hypothetical protein
VAKTNPQGIRIMPVKAHTDQMFSHFHRCIYLVGEAKLPLITPAIREIAIPMDRSVIPHLGPMPANFVFAFPVETRTLTGTRPSYYSQTGRLPSMIPRCSEAAPESCKGGRVIACEYS